MSTVNLTYERLTERGVSFELLRTNPKLTSNLKLSVDSSGNLWFNSIEATPELAKNKYKAVPIGPDTNHEINIFKFYDNGKTPNKISFAVGSTVTTETVASDLKDQYDFDLYSSGAKYLTSKEYSEKFRYLAPLYMDSVLPEYFVILKIPGASNYTVGEWKQKMANSNFSNLDFAIDFFRNAEIVKSFDLSEKSNIGRYIRNIQRDPMYNRNPLYVNFKEGAYSVYRGASISTGTYVEIPELLSATLRQSIPQLRLEKYITEGFERNNIVYPKILNLEFLFDDDSSDDYSINRYLGFYCNLIDIAKFDIDIKAMYENVDNDNPLPFEFRKEDEINVNITNSNGVILRGIGVDTDLTDLDTAMTSANSMFFPFFKAKDNTLHFPKIQTLEQVQNAIKFRLSDTTFDLGTTFGPGELYSQEEAKQSTTKTRSTVSVSIESKPNHLDTLRVYHTNGYSFDRNDSGGNFDDIIFVIDDNDDDGYVNVFPNNEAYLLDYSNYDSVSFNSVDPNTASPIFSPSLPETLGVQYVSSVDSSKWIWDGVEYVEEVMGSRIYVNINNATINGVKSTDATQLAKTVVTIIKNLKSSYLTAKNYENTIFIQVSPYGNHYGQLAVRALDSTSDRIYVNGQSTSSKVMADGGFLEIKQAIVPSDNITRLTPILDDLVVKTEIDWSKIARVSYASQYVENSPLSEADVDNYLSNSTLMLKDDEPIDVNYDTIEIREIFKPTIGVLSLFEIRDIDFYTYSSQYSKVPEVDFYQYYWVPPNSSIINFEEYVYEVVGNGTIEINNIQYSTEDSDTTVWQNVEGLQQYTIIDGNPILVQSNKKPNSSEVLRQDIARLDEDENIANFTGFFALGADHSIPNEDLPTYQYREKYKTNNLLSEYHVYLENFSKDFSVDGRVVPYITKWGIFNSTDARGNPYRLNSDILFGEDNFGPSHKETSPTSEKLTHEWFYIESDFNYSDCQTLIKKNYFYFNEAFDVSKMAADSSYFLDYFTYIPTFNGKEVDRPQFRYSKLTRDQFTNQYSTIFKGAKFNFAEMDSSGEVLEDTDRFDNYSFSILLKPIKEEILSYQNPIKYRIIENVDAQAIVLLIEMPIGYKSNINTRLLEDTIYSTIDGNVLQFPDRRLDQTNLFLDGLGAISDLGKTEFQVDWIYTTENSSAGDNLFNNILTSNYPSFSNSDFLNGVALNTTTGKTLSGFYIPENDETILIRKGSNTNTQFIAAFENSNLFKMASSGLLQSGARNLSGGASFTEQYLIVNIPKLGYLEDEGSLFRIIEDSALAQRRIPLSLDSKLVINRVLPGFLSMIGDYRIDFNSAGLSNLTYNFLYSAKDKKYNSTKAAYATTKLALGVDLSSTSYNASDREYYLSAKKLASLSIEEFKLEDFVNPISGSHDTFTNTVLNSLISPSDPEIKAPLPAFSPLMFINKLGEVSFLLNSEADFTLTDSETELQLINPSLTTDAIKTVNENLLILNKANDKDTIVLKINFTADPIAGPLFELDKADYPTKTPAYWLNDNIQFQLFGGRNYFSNLFETLSFANFKLLLERESDVISWESYENGILSNTQQILIRVEEADLIQKSTIVKLTPEIVSTKSDTTTGGFIHTEEASTSYEMFRYSGEYDIITRPISGFKQNLNIGDYSFNGANTFLNPEIRDFFVIPEFSFVKYSNVSILDFENSDKFEPLYPMIYESPIDFSTYFALSSSWDFNYHYNYLTKKKKTKIPGSRRLTEDYSFVSKLINLPLSFNIEQFNWVELTNQEFDIPDKDFLKLKRNGNLVDFAFSTYASEIRFKINFSQVLAKSISDNTLDNEERLRKEFEKFFVSGSQVITSDSESLGNLTFDEYLYRYCKANLLSLYELGEVDFYEKPNRLISDNSIAISQVPYDLLDNAGYSRIKSVKINNKKSGILTGSLLKKSSSGISLVPKLKIKYI